MVYIEKFVPTYASYLDNLGKFGKLGKQEILKSSDNQIKTDTGSSFANSFQEFGYTQTVRLIAFLKREGIITNYYRNSTIVDFGAGWGGSSLYFFGGTNNHVIAVDTNCEALENLKSRSSKNLQVICDDGIKVMGEMLPGSVDLVFALMFGPTKDSNFVRKFLSVAGEVLKHDGRVIVFSEHDTMELFKEYRGNFINSTPIGGAVFVATRDDLSKKDL